MVRYVRTRGGTEPLLTVHVTAVSPETCPALVLNADFRPLSYYPLSVWGWQDAIKAVFLDRVNIVSEYEHAVRSPSFSMRLPSVVSLKSYVKPSRFPAFTPFQRVPARPLHLPILRRARRSDVRPRHPALEGRGHLVGRMSSTACSACNLRKADLLPAKVARMWPDCGSPTSRRCMTCTRTAASSRPTTSMRAGWIISIGTANWSRESQALACCFSDRPRSAT